MVMLHFDIRDLFRAIRLGWSGKKIWVGLCGLFSTYAGYSILVTLAHLSAGSSLSQIWHRYGLFPGASPEALPPVGMVLNLVAMVFSLVAIFLTLCMVCKITYEQLRGDDFYSSGDAWGFIKKNWKAVLLGPVATLALFLFFVIAGILIGWVAGLVPVVGELVFAVSFIPIFFSALIAVFIALVFMVAFTMSPAIVGTVGEDTLEVVIQSFSLAWSQPWRLVLYLAWMKISVWFGVMVLGALMASALGLVGWACGLFMGMKLSNMLYAAGMYLPFDVTQWDFDFLVAQYSVDMMEFLPEPAALSGVDMWSGRILTVMLIALTGVLLSYALSAYASGISMIYVILRKRKDDENLLEWEDEMFGEEEPVVEAGGSSGETEAAGETGGGNSSESG